MKSLYILLAVVSLALISYIFICNTLYSELLDTREQAEYYHQQESLWRKSVHKYMDEAKKYKELYQHELNNEKWIMQDEDGNIVVVSEDGTITERN